MPKTTKKVKPTRDTLENLYALLIKKGFNKYIEWQSIDFRKETLYGHAIFSFVQLASERGFKHLSCIYYVDTKQVGQIHRVQRFDKPNKYPDAEYIEKAIKFLDVLDSELCRVFQELYKLSETVTKKVLGDNNG